MKRRPQSVMPVPEKGWTRSRNARILMETVVSRDRVFRCGAGVPENTLPAPHRRSGRPLCRFRLAFAGACADQGQRCRVTGGIPPIADFGKTAV